MPLNLKQPGLDVKLLWFRHQAHILVFRDFLGQRNGGCRFVSQEHYQKLVQAITTRFSPEEIQIISLGALRFQPEQRHMMRERFVTPTQVHALFATSTVALVFNFRGGQTFPIARTLERKFAVLD